MTRDDRVRVCTYGPYGLGRTLAIRIKHLTIYHRQRDENPRKIGVQSRGRTGPRILLSISQTAAGAVYAGGFFGLI